MPIKTAKTRATFLITVKTLIASVLALVASIISDAIKLAIWTHKGQSVLMFKKLKTKAQRQLLSQSIRTTYTAQQRICQCLTVWQRSKPTNKNTLDRGWLSAREKHMQHYKKLAADQVTATISPSVQKIFSRHIVKAIAKLA